MNECLPLISIQVYKLGRGWCVSLSPGFSISWPPEKLKTKAEAMKVARAIQRVIKDFDPTDESDRTAEMHALIKKEVLRRVASTETIS
jgi:hypothetical protein